ncbi:hypothetical protein SanaruYs_28020 [Chryseotalea sanaruensis]|uniref:Uncharacterized protein n=1 Tax=Chryseotalea sanaruensis TaxID=2482724 RepID=A0A401UCF6_9BACT|nr:ankyrin repeat domain-containing protein [Chryseotalea sanaruensis]GCC52565.1 hypothetical protein SanaruYs_28020 [Chryseotalea sanaruensis]
MYKSLDNVIRKTGSEEEWISKLKNIKDYNVLDSEGNSPLTLSAYYGYLDGCKYIINNGGNVDFVDKYCRTPLLCATTSLTISSGISLFERVRDIVYFLIEHNADVNKVGEDGVSSLMNTLDNYCTDIAVTLIKKGAHVNSRNKWQMTPLMYAKGIDINIYQELIEAGAEINAVDELGRNPLYHALYDAQEEFKKNNESITSLLLRQGANINTGDSSRGDTLLHVAASKGHVNLISILLNSGHKLNVQDKEGDTPLIKACKMNKIEAVKKLLEHGADLSLVNERGESAMTHAVSNIIYNGDNQLKEILVEYGAAAPKILGDVDVDEVNENGDTAIILASEVGPLEKLKKLISRGANVNHQNKEGKTALMLACCSAGEEKVELLLKSGADINIQDNYDKTALIYLMDKNYYGDSHRKKFNFLLEAYDINVNLQTRSGMTALMYVCRQTYLEHDYIERLIKKGAKVNIETKKGKTVFSFVKNDFNLKELKALLLKYD